MAYLGPVRRWDVFWADLEPTVGREQAGDHRPVLVVSSDRFSNSPLRPRLDDPDLYGEIEDALVAHLGIELE